MIKLIKTKTNENRKNNGVIKKAIKKATPNLKKIKDVDKHIDEIKNFNTKTNE